MASSRLLKVAENLAGKTVTVSTRLGMKGQEIAKRSWPHLSSVWSTARVELAPPLPSEFPAIRKSFTNMRKNLVEGKFLQATTKEAAANALVGVEIFFWFIVGEMIGRKSVVGYNV